MSTSMRILDRDERHEANLQDDGHVLFVVDDDVATQELLCEVAQEAGWSAFGFRRLAEVSDALDERRPTVLILDDDLPDGRGGDLARTLRNDPRMRHVTLLVCTAAHPMRQAEIGAWAPVVSKPFDLREIESILASAGRAAPSRDYGRAG
jgi:DNA-binding response OmpR family regulator